jgi:hypothetical protein
LKPEDSQLSQPRSKKLQGSQHVLLREQWRPLWPVVPERDFKRVFHAIPGALDAVFETPEAHGHGFTGWEQFAQIYKRGRIRESNKKTANHWRFLTKRIYKIVQSEE